MRLFGKHERLGEISVRLNPDILSTGQIMPKVFAAGAEESTTAAAEEPQTCRIATAAIFTVGPLGEVFNKEPILLMNEHVTRIPPVDDPSGHALLFRLPLYHRRDPDGEPVAYLTSLRYGADSYITEAEAKAFRERRS